MNTKLFNKNFTLVVIGQIISLFGNAILRFALPLYILEISGSPALFGLVSACAFLPMIIMSPLGGIVADRVNKQRIMVVLDFVTAALIAAFTILSTQVAIVPLMIVTLMALYGIQGAYSPSVQASIPLLVAENQIMSANAVVNLVQSMSGLLGPVIGGILFGSFGLYPILFVSGGAFFISAVIELFIKIPHTKQPAESSVIKIVKSDMKLSFNFMFRQYPAMAKVMVLIFCINIFLTSLFVIGIPVIVTKFLGLSSQLYGINQGVQAAGGLIGGVLAGVAGKKLSVERSWKLLLLCSLGLFPMGIILLSGAPELVSFWVLTVMGMLVMICSTIFSIQLLAFAQMKTPIELVGKVIACIMSVSMCSQPIGQAMFGFLFEKFAQQPGIIVIGAAAAAVVISLYSKRVFNKLSDEDQAEQEILGYSV